MSRNWEFFTEQEMQCKGTGECDMDERFMLKLIELRIKFNEPMIITSKTSFLTSDVYPTHFFI